MCRWLAYSGNPIPIAWVVLQPVHSLIDQSLHSRLGATTTNGDGFGLGWYDRQGSPGLYRTVHPAWNDRNLRELATHIRAGMFLAHIRASTGSAVQETNTHPFRHERWMFVHNGLIRDFNEVKRDLLFEVEPALLPAIEGSADSELLFHLALTFGLKEDPVAGLERAVGLVEAVGRAHHVEHPIQMTVAIADGERVTAVRYSSEHSSRSLFFSTDVYTLRARYPHDERLQELSDEARIVVSEPLGDLAGAWNEVPEATALTVQPGEDATRPFVPSPP